MLTGFKFIGEKIKQWEENQHRTFMFGFEESYGYLCGTHARDKDAVVASMLMGSVPLGRTHAHMSPPSSYFSTLALGRFTA